MDRTILRAFGHIDISCLSPDLGVYLMHLCFYPQLFCQISYDFVP